MTLSVALRRIRILNMNVGEYRKLIATVFGGLVTLAAALGVPLAWASPEVVSAVAALVATGIATWAVPNNPPKEKQDVSS